MSIRIDNDRQLKTAQDFIEFIKEHNKRALAKQDNDDMYDIAVRMASLINAMAKALTVKQTEIGQLKSEIEDLRSQAEQFKESINDLEREIRVSKDLLAIAKVVSDDVK